LFPNHDRLLCDAPNAIDDFVSLVLSGSGVAKQHKLRHKTYLLFSDPVNFLLVSIFTLKFSQTLRHDDLVLLG
jgi:hypothetical protein